MKKIVLFIPILLVSCDAETTDYFYIDNQSDFDVIAEFNVNNTNNNIIAAANFKTLIFEYYDFGGNAKDKGNNFLNVFNNTLLLTINDSLTIDLDYLQRENWNLEITDGAALVPGDGGESKYTLIIMNENIIEN